MNNQVIHLSNDNFDQIMSDQSKPILVDFWAPWCMPCRTLGPVMDELAVESSDKVTIAKVNVDENPELAAKFGIRGIPTVKGFNNGAEVFSTSGAYPKAYWVEVIQTLQKN